jgi:nucleoside-diphosphate-sugar epimerase
VVAGCNGLNGGNLIKHLLNTEQWNVIGIGRNAPKNWSWNNNEHFRFVGVDLSDRMACNDAFTSWQFVEANYLFYAAYSKSATAEEDIQTNASMFRNCLELLHDRCNKLTGVALYSSTRYYGVHLGPYKTPATENDPRHLGINFQFNQEDFLREFQRGKSWNYVIVRPAPSVGYSPKSEHNLAVSIAVYATMCREYPEFIFKFPGTTESYNAANDCCCSDLLGEMMNWWAIEGVNDHRSRNTVFNVANGDIFRYRYLWPFFASYFNIPFEEPEGNIQYNTTSTIAGMQRKWDDIVHKHGLVPTRLNDLCSFEFLDFVCHKNYDSIVNINKLKTAGFLEFRITENCFENTFNELKKLKIIPNYN